MSALVKETEVTRVKSLETRYENDIWLKREDQQPVYSFKLRGAFHCLQKLPKGSHVVTASAGNHAQGLALSATHLGHHARIVMPDTTPQIKIDAVRDFGGQVIIHGHNFDVANAYALQLANNDSTIFVPPFDDEGVIIGQGTVAKELLAQLPHLDAVFIPVGGGGLLAGMSAYIKSVNPTIKVIAVEAEDSACLDAAMKAGKPVDLSYVGSFADGVAVKRIGKETFRVAQQFCDEVVTVSSDAICAAMQDIFVSMRAISEPSGALSLAGLKLWCDSNQQTGLQLAAVLSGANLNFNTLRYVAERTSLGQRNEALLAVTIPEEKGSFKRFCKDLAGRPITEFNYRYAKEKVAEIFVGVGLRNGGDELAEFKAQLHEHHYAFIDMSDNELAKLHVRYMVGGKPGTEIKERLFRFDFPEYPGALLRFLETLGSKWNISLFHYRNQGAAIGNVLAGIEVPESDYQEFTQHLKRLNYQYHEETDNPCYQRFLG
ncbi:PLP-dependent threonine dehydratase [Candidatus Endobugula sertula]|uniref:L-threonine dehydratase n=1 Tax=Candidatus Endobugula sertula TaxID=62101 RepID=A0A1D2QQZ1_9GAMM|nr:PLP-dependent threonine dehydratase [Candidatus Endobugula sertula]